jgi:hypothetical protein
MKMTLAALIAIGAVGFAGSAIAQDAPATPITPGTPQSLACVNSGQVYMPGQIACIPGCHGAERLARCDIVQSTTIWTTVSNDCPIANMTPLAETVLAMMNQSRPASDR